MNWKNPIRVFAVLGWLIVQGVVLLGWTGWRLFQGLMLLGWTVFRVVQSLDNSLSGSVEVPAPRSRPGREAAQRTLDGEDRSAIIRGEGKGVQEDETGRS